MCSKDKFNTTLRITQLEIKCFIDNTTNYFEIMILVGKVYTCYNKNIYWYIIKEIILMKKGLKIT